jgi:hypothetical protein
MEQQTKKIILIVLWSLGALLLLAGIFLAWAFFSQFKTFEDKPLGFKIKYPSQWQRIDGYQGTVVAFVKPKKTALDVFQPNVNITVQEVPVHLGTLGSFSETVTKQMLAVFGKSINVVEDKSFFFGERLGHRLILEAQKPDNLKMMVVWTLKDSMGYIFTFLAREDQYKELIPLIDLMVDSFQFK